MTTAVALRSVDHPVANAVRAAAPQFAPFLPAGVDVEQIAAAVFLEAQRVPALAKCRPETIVAAASKLVQWGFDIGRTGFLVPFKDVATPVPGYKGFIELVLATGAAHDCDAREVRKGDLFEYSFGTEARLLHVPGRINPNRGQITHFYVCWKVRFGHTKFDVMSLDEVEDLRLRYSKQWGADKWARGACEPWYGIKTVIRRSAKQLPQNPKLTKFFAALKADEEQELGGNPVTDTKLDAPRDVGEAAPSVPAFEEEQEPASVRLPKWRGHPLAEKLLSEVSRDDLEALYSQLSGASEKGDKRYDALNAQIAAELDERRQAA